MEVLISIDVDEIVEIFNGSEPKKSFNLVLVFFLLDFMLAYVCVTQFYGSLKFVFFLNLWLSI